MTRSSRSAIAVLVGVAIAALLVGCGMSGSSGSRHHVYGSLDELIGDSIVIVTGVAGDSATLDFDGIKYEAWTLAVTEQLSPAGLGQKPVDAAPSGVTPQRPGEVGKTVTVLQVPDGPGPSLEEGSTYLIFLTATWLPESPADSFFITGAYAGLYESDGDVYKKTTDDGDSIPDTLVPDQLR